MIHRNTAPRKRRPGKRRGPMRDPKYRAWLREQICCIYGPCRGADNLECVYLQTDPAHTGKVNGMSSKAADSTCAPLCRKHHDEYDSGRTKFEAKYRVDMKALAAEYYNRYLTENGTKAGLPPAEQGDTIEW